MTNLDNLTPDQLRRVDAMLAKWDGWQEVSHDKVGEWDGWRNMYGPIHEWRGVYPGINPEWGTRREIPHYRYNSFSFSVLATELMCRGLIASEMGLTFDAAVDAVLRAEGLDLAAVMAAEGLEVAG